jgi:hypothetical protein
MEKYKFLSEIPAGFMFSVTNTYRETEKWYQITAGKE